MTYTATTQYNISQENKKKYPITDAQKKTYTENSSIHKFTSYEDYESTCCVYNRMDATWVEGDSEEIKNDPYSTYNLLSGTN
jgi:hypothetical protein